MKKKFKKCLHISEKVYIFALENKNKVASMIKKKGVFRIYDVDDADFKELNDSVDELPPGEYGFLIYDNSKNRSLPQLK